MKGDLTLGEPEIVELHRQLQAALVQTEGKVFELETMFLEETAINNSLVRSWENGNSRATIKAGAAKKKLVLADRIFSLSSMSSGAYKLMDEEQCTEGTDQYKSYLQKRKPPRPIKALQDLSKPKRDEKGKKKVSEDYSMSRSRSPNGAKLRSSAKAKLKLKSTKKRK